MTVLKDVIQPSGPEFGVRLNCYVSEHLSSGLGSIYNHHQAFHWPRRQIK